MRTRTWLGVLLGLLAFDATPIRAVAQDAAPEAPIAAAEDERADPSAVPEPTPDEAAAPEREADPAARDVAPSEDDLGALETLLGEEVVTTASRVAERASAAPATVTTIDGETLRRFGMRSLDEALSYLGLGTFVGRSGRDYTSEQDVGFQGVLLRDRNRHVLVLLDGHVVNAQSTGETRLDVALGIPLELVDHVELMLGPGSVSYGSNAMMAVVNVVTRRARDYGTARLVAEGTLAAPTGVSSSYSFGGGGDRFGGRSRLGAGFARAGTLFGRPAEILVHAEWQQEISATYRIPYQTGDVFDVRPGEPGWGGVARHRMNMPTAYVSARVGDARLFLQGNAYRRTLPLVGSFDESTSRELLAHLRGELRHDADLTAEITLASRLYGDHVRSDERSDWLRAFYCLPGQQLDGCHFQRRNASSSVGLEEQLTIDWRLDGRFVTTVGGDLRYRLGVARPADYVDRVTGALPYTVELPYWRSRSVLGAVFAQQLIRLGDSVVLNLGARFDADSLFGVHLSPRAALTYLPTDRTTLRVGFSEAFRAPSAQELRDSDPTYALPPRSLEAEVVRTVDLELAQRFSRGSIAVRAFGSIFDGMLAQRTVTMDEFDAGLAAGQLVSNADPAFVVVWDNADVIRAVGGTFAGRVEPVRGLELATNLTVAANEQRGYGSLPIVPTFYGNARASYRFGEEGVVLGLVCRAGSRRSAANETGSGFVTSIDAGWAFALRATVDAPIAAAPGLRMRAFVDASPGGQEPYVYSPGPTVDDPANRTVLAPTPRLFAFVGVSYDLP